MQAKLIWSVTLAMFVLFLTLLTGCSSLSMKATPFYKGKYSKPQSPPEERINLWPLMYYHKPVMSILWPVGEKTDDHITVRPVISVFKLDSKRHEYNVLWPLAQFDFDTGNHRVFPFFWGEQAPDRKYFVAFPEIWWTKNAKSVLPLIWWDKGFSVFPIIFYNKSTICHFFPLWLYRNSGQGSDTHVLWPIFRRQDELNKQGFRVWPFFGRYTRPGNRIHSYALWPFCHLMRDNLADVTTRIVFPLYYQQTHADYGRYLVMPLIYRQNSRSGHMTLTPIWCSGERGEARWHATLPLYYYSVNYTSKTNRLLTPLVGKTQSEERTRWFVFPFLSSVAWGEGKKDIWMLAPMARFRWGQGNVQNHILPVFAYDRNRKKVLTPLVSWQNRKNAGFVNLLGFVAHYAYKGEDQKEIYLAPPLAGVRWRENFGCEHVRALPLFSWSRVGDERSLWVSPWMLLKKSLNVQKNSFFPFWHYSRTLSYRSFGSSPVVPLIGQPDQTLKEQWDIDFRILGWLYDYHARTKTPEKNSGKSEGYVLAHFLLYLMHYERDNDHMTLDLFPFITYDRDTGEGFRKCSFAWRLFRYERRSDGELDIDFFYIPLRRGNKEAGSEGSVYFSWGCKNG